MIGKIIAWVLLNGATLLGVLQAIIKAVKELLTGILNLLSLFMPIAVAQAIIDKIRAVLNKIDEYIEIIKKFLLPKA